MSFIHWHDSLSVGIEIIDDQHKELIYRVNKLLDSMRSGKGREEAEIIIEFLEEYIIAHFREEEHFMINYHYPKINFDSHKEEHDQFIKTYAEIKEKILNKRVNSAFVIELQQFLSVWLTNHFYMADHDMGKFLMEHMDQS